MPNFTFSLAAGFMAAALWLAAPAAHAQDTGVVTADLGGASPEVTRLHAARTNAAAPDEAVRHLNASAAELSTAAYYNDSHKDLTQALAWMQETNALHPEYWSVYAEARIRLQLKDYAGAQVKAAEAKQLAVAAANADYAHRSEDLLAQAKTHVK